MRARQLLSFPEDLRESNGVQNYGAVYISNRLEDNCPNGLIVISLILTMNINKKNQTHHLNKLVQQHKPTSQKKNPTLAASGSFCVEFFVPL